MPVGGRVQSLPGFTAKVLREAREHPVTGDAVISHYRWRLGLLVAVASAVTVVAPGTANAYPIDGGPAPASPVVTASRVTAGQTTANHPVRTEPLHYLYVGVKLRNVRQRPDHTARIIGHRRWSDRVGYTRRLDGTRPYRGLTDQWLQLPRNSGYVWAGEMLASKPVAEKPQVARKVWVPTRVAPAASRSVRPPAPPRPRPATPRPRPTTRSGVRSAPAVAGGTVWDRLAGCEAGGNWRINTGNGFSGGLQFTPGTWRAYGGGAYAAYAYQASRSAQIAVARKVLAAQGWGAWPACSRKLGLR
jgi:hypothetical protein